MLWTKLDRIQEASQKRAAKAGGSVDKIVTGLVFGKAEAKPRAKSRSAEALIICRRLVGLSEYRGTCHIQAHAPSSVPVSSPDPRSKNAFSQPVPVSTRYGITDLGRRPCGSTTHRPAVARRSVRRHDIADPETLAA